MRSNIVILVLLIARFHAFIVYDCVDPTIELSRLSLLDVGECKYDHANINQSTVHIQLLQKTEYSKVYTYTCKVSVLRTLSHCGMHHHTSLVRNSISDYIYELSQEECSRAITLHSINLFGHVINNLNVNGSTSANIIAAGSITSDGYCKNGVYHERGTTWEDVVAQLFVKILLTTSYSTVELESKKLITNNGLTCHLESQNCVDYELGQVFWSPVPGNDCSSTHFDTVYTGIVTKAHEIIQDAGSVISPLTIYSVNSADVTFALTAIRSSKECGYTLIHTEHPKLFIVETVINGPFPSPRRIGSHNLDLSVYMNTKFVTLHRHIKQQVEDLYRSLANSRCDLERKVIRNSLSLAVISPDEFALNVMKGPGHMAYLAGEVVYMARCIPKEAILNPVDKCYLEIPVSVSGILNFARARSHVLQAYGTEVPCSKVLPPMFRLNGTWIQLNPSMSRVMSPDILGPKVTSSWNYESPGNLASSGIYSQEDLDKIKELMVFPLERQSIVNIMSRQIDGQTVSTQGVSISNLFDSDTLDQLKDSITKRLWSGFVSFGTVSAGLFGVYVVCKLSKLVLDTILHGIALHGIYGWSLYLIGALWDSLTNFLVALHYRRASQRAPDIINESPEKHDSQLESCYIPSSAPPEQKEFSSTYQYNPRLYPTIKDDVL